LKPLQKNGAKKKKKYCDTARQMMKERERQTDRKYLIFGGRIGKM
jgi:hypothetical protein